MSETRADGSTASTDGYLASAPRPQTLSLDPLPGALQMAQLQKSLLPSLLLVLLSSSSTSAGFVSPGNSVWVGESPTLRYLLACGHLPTKPPYFSTHDIYTLDQVFVFSPVPVFETYTTNQVAKGLRHLQAGLGLPQTGVEGEQERRVIKKGKCINNSPKSIKIAPAKIQQTSNPSVEVFAPPARYDTQEHSVEVFAPSSNRPSAPYVEQKKVNKVKKKTFSGCGAGLYGVGLRALSSCGSTFLSCFAGRSHLLHCPPGNL